eukprot:CAMPEP_0168623860 /NCGR_PEP_ID=MMETSP0449_2-20121227/9067_1 /TAXON_ID=1082188 /ORGANISM="Strombidium rassoulzadegani, Strain ras09" /LENGTH=238 /DNA_ID=CAMNT_0008665303 /DNA_START=27 /DNA_END=741 /DNA_ORIENTATION=+
MPGSVTSLAGKVHTPTSVSKKNDKAGKVDSFAVARLHGSLPMGGSVAGTPVHALRSGHPKFPLVEPSLQPTRNDIPLDGQIAFRVEDVLTSVECDEIVRVAEGLGFSEAAPGIATPPGMRMNKSCHWVTDGSLMDAIFCRAPVASAARRRQAAPETITQMNMYKYDRNDVFNRHIDGSWPAYGLNEDTTQMVEWKGVHSKLSLLLYLNGVEDGVSGGSTELYSNAGRAHESKPKKGSA